MVVTAQQQIGGLDSNAHYGLFARAEALLNFDTLWFGVADSTSLAFHGESMAGTTAAAVSSSSRYCRFAFPSFVASAWHELEVRLAGQQAELYLDRTRLGDCDLPPEAATAGRVGVSAGYSNVYAEWDDIIVRRYVNPEPMVRGGTVEACP